MSQIWKIWVKKCLKPPPSFPCDQSLLLRCKNSLPVWRAVRPSLRHSTPPPGGWFSGTTGGHVWHPFRGVVCWMKQRVKPGKKRRNLNDILMKSYYLAAQTCRCVLSGWNCCDDTLWWDCWWQSNFVSQRSNCVKSCQQNVVNYQAKLEDDWTAILRTMVTSSSKEGALRNIFNISFAKEQYGNNMKVMPIYIYRVIIRHYGGKRSDTQYPSIQSLWNNYFQEHRSGGNFCCLQKFEIKISTNMNILIT